MDPRTPTPGTDTGMSRKTLSQHLGDVHHLAVRLAGVLRAVAHLENEGGCEEGRATLVFLAEELGDQLANDLDGVNIPKEVA